MTTRTTEYRYNVDGLLEELVCHNGEEGEQVTRWEYGTELNEDGSGIARADLVRAKVYPDGGRVEYGYNRLSEVTEMEDPNGTVHEYAYDAVNRLIADRVTEVGAGIDGAVQAIRISYVARGEVERVTSYDDPDATVPEHVVNDVLYTYNWYGQVTEEFQSHDGPADTLSWGVAYGYDTGSGNKSRLAGLRYPNNHLVLYRFLSAVDDGFNKVSNIGPVDGAPDVNYQRLGLDVTVETSYLSGLQMTALRQGLEGVGDGGDIYAGLDRFGRFQEARWVDVTPVPALNVERVECGFDRVGNRKWRRNVLSGAQPWDEIYRYDGLYQVTGLERGKLNVNRTGVNGVPAWQEQWRYDAMGNWLRYDTAANGTPGLEQERVYNSANELQFINGSNALQGFDAVGNMTRAPRPEDWEDGFDLKWDAWNRLVEISDAESEALVARYGYDGLTRRITKETDFSTTPVLRHFYYTNRWQVVEERLDGSATAERQFLWGIKHVDDLVYRERFDAEGAPTERLWALNDGKNVTAIAFESEVVQRVAYSAFGLPELLMPDFTPRTSSDPDYGWETLFCGYRWDRESALYQVRFRYYHPELGRWLSRDPIGELLHLASTAFRLSHPLPLSVFIPITISGKDLLDELRLVERSQSSLLQMWRVENTSLLTYCAGNPITRIDPSGLVGIENTGGTSNCLGYAMTGHNATFKYPNVYKDPNVSFKDALEKCGWKCAEIKSLAECKCACEVAKMVIAVYGHPKKEMNPFTDPKYPWDGVVSDLHAIRAESGCTQNYKNVPNRSNYSPGKIAPVKEFGMFAPKLNPMLCCCQNKK